MFRIDPPQSKSDADEMSLMNFLRDIIVV
jgi:hypothetical protein